ncbi:hypothetical protein M0805_003594 [Coniferiporia weirii]|nr:hypothetical protein M0805_003594 [Coniferiporia weirii]
MRFFSLFALAAAAVAPFVSAAPLDASAGAAAGAVVHARGGQPKGCAEVLLDLKVGLGVHITELGYLNKANATTDVIVPILTDVVSVVADAVVDLKVLVGLDHDVIFASVDGYAVVTVSVIAHLLADVLCLICGALAIVLTIVADVTILVEAIVSVALGNCLCELISAVICIVDGLLVCLIPLVLYLANILVTLGLTAVGSLLTIC